MQFYFFFSFIYTWFSPKGNRLILIRLTSWCVAARLPSSERMWLIGWLTTDWKCTLCKIKQPGDFLRLYEILRTEQEDIIRGLMHFNLFCTLIRLFIHTTQLLWQWVWRVLGLHCTGSGPSAHLAMLTRLLIWTNPRYLHLVHTLSNFPIRVPM